MLLAILLSPAVFAQSESQATEAAAPAPLAAVEVSVSAVQQPIALEATDESAALSLINQAVLSDLQKRMDIDLIDQELVQLADEKLVSAAADL
jgi:hypothetical protein